jgi:anti-sigma-K factor RskA
MTDDLIATAGEYVAGLMTSEEQEAFERRIATDADVRRAVADWRERLLALDEARPATGRSSSAWRSMPR